MTKRLSNSKAAIVIWSIATPSLVSRSQTEKPQQSDPARHV
jgi:hypothetical protein